MRNLKRALSLALASVMVLGLMIVGSSAISTASEQYDDYGDVDYKEALDVLTAADILDGFKDNQFAPYESLTREQAAKILAVMHLGRDKADSLAKTATGFSDVLAGRWSAGYIGYCSNLGLIAGNGDGTFNPEGKLTGAQFGKMLLVALGYDPEIEGFVNRVDWELNVSTMMTKAGIDIDDVRVSEPITREQAAQLVLNTIKAPMVEYANRTQVSVGGTDITLGGSKANYVTTALARASRISKRQLSNTDIGGDGNADRGFTVEFGEQYLTDLYQNEFDYDDFGRPCRTWTWKNEEIGTYVKTENLVASYTTGVTGRTIYDLLGQEIINDALADRRFVLDVDGIFDADEVFYLQGAYDRSKFNDYVTDTFNHSNTNAIKQSGNGVLTEVYLDTDVDWENNTQVIISSINTYLAKGKTTYKASDEEANVTVYFDSTGKTRKVELDNVPNAADVVKDSYYLVNISYREDTTNGIIVSLSTPEILNNKTVTKFSKYNGTVDSVTTDGTPYSGSKKSFYDINELNKYDKQLLTDKTYNIYVDQYGYAIGVDLFSGSKSYVFITGYNRPNSNLAVSTIEAEGIFLDGTMKAIQVNRNATNNNIKDLYDSAEYDLDDKETKIMQGYYKTWEKEFEPSNTGDEGNAQLNRWFSYTVNADGVYTLTPATMNLRTYDTSNTDATKNQDRINTGSVNITGNYENTANKKYDTDAKAWVDTDAYKDSDRQNRSYGEDASVYITVGLDIVDTVSHKAQITKVNDVLTGVQNADIKIDMSDKTRYTVTGDDGPETKQLPQVYTVYEDSYIVGAIIISASSSSVESTAYIVSDVTSEGKDVDSGAYYWEFTAIVNGEKQVLQLKGDYNSKIARGNVVKLKFDSDGYVTDVGSVKQYSLAETLKDDLDRADITDDYDVYAISRDDADTNSLPYLTLNAQGKTLYITADQTDLGLAVASDAPVFIWKDGNTSHITKYDTLKEAVEELDDMQGEEAAGKQFRGNIIAALNSNGSAAWIIFDATNYWSANIIDE